jgi:hypothetical protein
MDVLYTAILMLTDLHHLLLRTLMFVLIEIQVCYNVCCYTLFLKKVSYCCDLLIPVNKKVINRCVVNNKR